VTSRGASVISFVGKGRAGLGICSRFLIIGGLLAGLFTTTTGTVAASYSAGVWTNTTAFSSACGIYGNTNPMEMANAAKNGMSALGYAVTPIVTGSSFTRSEFLSAYPAKYSVYVHSHGDLYWGSGWIWNATYSYGVDSGFLEDAGRCKASENVIRASSIYKASAPPYYLVIMSTCVLGTDDIYYNQIPAAFGFPRDSSGRTYSKATSQKQFFLGYTIYAYDSDEANFENTFWYFMVDVGFSPAMAFYNAKADYGYFVSPNWFGNPNWNGRP
jgi:hypothetical protein